MHAADGRASGIYSGSSDSCFVFISTVGPFQFGTLVHYISKYLLKDQMWMESVCRDGD